MKLSPADRLRMPSGDSIDEAQKINAVIDAVEKHIVKYFLEALRNKNTAVLFEIAEAVDFLNNYDNSKRDELRARILHLKWSLEYNKKRCSMPELAKILKGEYPLATRNVAR